MRVRASRPRYPVLRKQLRDADDGIRTEPSLQHWVGALIGPGGFTGALTAIVGIGVIQFSSDCSTISGELIYNDGDLQFLEESAARRRWRPGGVLLGRKETICRSVVCRASTVATISPVGASRPRAQPPGLSLLQFTANFGFYDYGLGIPPRRFPFAFNIQETNGDTTLVGNTVPSPTAPVLTLTMQQQTSESGSHHFWQRSVRRQRCNHLQRPRRQP